MAAKTQKEREDRIENEIVADAHDAEERTTGWYCYLQDSISPFTATCTAERDISPLQRGDAVEVIDMASEEECEHEMFVKIRWEKRGLGVPLSQLKPGKNADEPTRQAVEDWLYWVKQGYEF